VKLLSGPVNFDFRIFIIRGQRVILDAHLAEIYAVETRALNQAVRRNIERFPADFMFQLTRSEIEGISQFVISSGHPEIKFSKRVTAFTENGDHANIEIMRAFTRLRGAHAIHKSVLRKLALLEHKVHGHEDQLQILAEAISELQDVGEEPRKKIGF
jgi:hypothetical protein